MNHYSLFVLTSNDRTNQAAYMKVADGTRGHLGPLMDLLNKNRARGGGVKGYAIFDKRTGGLVSSTI